LDAVLPLRAMDLDRFELLDRSLARFVSGLETLWLVVPRGDVEQIQRFVATRARHARIRVESELTWIPELAAFPRLGGWYRQQLCKLEAANQVTTDCYLTLDADLIATRALDLKTLVVDGRAPCSVDHRDLHPRWYGGVARILDAPLARSGIAHNVTPTILNRRGVQSLHAYLDQRWRSRQYARGFCGLKQRAARLIARTKGLRDAAGWRVTLIASAPWAEYALYFSFLEIRGTFAEYHREVSQALYTVGDSVWFDRDFERWDPARVFASDAPHYFVVVQSTAGIDAARLGARVAMFLE
jgi:hypothetical protein